MTASPDPAGPTAPLAADCARCVGLCCVVLPFGRSADFAFDKAGGEPCRHLVGPGQGAGCAIHARLRESGMRGCTVYECLGAGQQVVQVTYRGRAVGTDPEVQAVFAVVRRLHELLVLLGEAERRGDPAPAARAAALARTVAPPAPATRRRCSPSTSTPCGPPPATCCAR